MKQKQYRPLSVAEMAISLFAVERGLLDDVIIPKIVSFETDLHQYMNDKHKAFMDEINAHCGFDDKIADQMKEAIIAFKKLGNWNA